MEKWRISTAYHIVSAYKFDDGETDYQTWDYDLGNLAHKDFDSLPKLVDEVKKALWGDVILDFDEDRLQFMWTTDADNVPLNDKEIEMWRNGEIDLIYEHMLSLTIDFIEVYPVGGAAFVEAGLFPDIQL